nr:hypothetical protein [uncultured Shinella sp.]
MTSTLSCTACGLEKTESVVQGGSYLLRCANCGEMIVATSFIAMLDSDSLCSAFIDPCPGIQPSHEALIARGPLRQIAMAITQAAYGGTLIRLLPDVKDSSHEPSL